MSPLAYPCPLPMERHLSRRFCSLQLARRFPPDPPLPAPLEFSFLGQSTRPRLPRPEVSTRSLQQEGSGRRDQGGSWQSAGGQTLLPTQAAKHLSSSWLRDVILAQLKP